MDAEFASDPTLCAGRRARVAHGRLWAALAERSTDSSVHADDPAGHSAPLAAPRAARAAHRISATCSGLGAHPG